MVKVYPFVGAVITLVALILLAVGASTNRWVTIKQVDPHLNPTVVNSDLNTRPASRLGVTFGNFHISYVMSQFGLWVGCHKEHKSAVSCAFINSRCLSNVCWIRVTADSRSTTCLRERTAPLVNCTAFQVVRVFTVIGLALLLFGACAQWVSLLSVRRSLAMLAGIVVFLSAVVLVVAVSVFDIHVWQAGVEDGVGGYISLKSIGTRGYSFILVAITIPLCIVGAIVSCIAASMGLQHKEVSDYSASNY